LTEKNKGVRHFSRFSRSGRRTTDTLVGSGFTQPAVGIFIVPIVCFYRTSYVYDARGNRTSVIDPINGSGHPTTFAYGATNRLTGITHPDNTTVSYGHDYRGRRTSATDQNNKTTTYVYDDADRLTSITDAATSLTQYN
jgi:YD repeat-containing protein